MRAKDFHMHVKRLTWEEDREYMSNLLKNIFDYSNYGKFFDVPKRKMRVRYKQISYTKHFIERMQQRSDVELNIMRRHFEAAFLEAMRKKLNAPLHNGAILTIAKLDLEHGRGHKHRYAVIWRIVNSEIILLTLYKVMKKGEAKQIVKKYLTTTHPNDICHGWEINKDENYLADWKE